MIENEKEQEINEIMAALDVLAEQNPAYKMVLLDMFKVTELCNLMRSLGKTSAKVQGYDEIAAKFHMAAVGLSKLWLYVHREELDFSAPGEKQNE